MFAKITIFECKSGKKKKKIQRLFEELSVKFNALKVFIVLRRMNGSNHELVARICPENSIFGLRLNDFFCHNYA